MGCPNFRGFALDQLESHAYNESTCETIVGTAPNERLRGVLSMRLFTFVLRLIIIYPRHPI